jgi:type VI secretion system protein ImpG
MEDEFLNYYNDELKFIREMSGEFARDFPKVAGRLSLDPDGQNQCADPFVERLLEGVAFLTARVRQKQDSEFPRWTQSFFESVYPSYTSPVPSMGVVKIQPKLQEADLASGFKIPGKTAFRARLNSGERTACIYKTAHDVVLYPLGVDSADYYDRTLYQLGISERFLEGISAGLKLNFVTTAGTEGDELPASELDLDELDLHFRGAGDIPVRIFEYLMTQTRQILVRPIGGGAGTEIPLGFSAIQPMGMNEDQALLPPDARLFEGYRILREYFACPRRFLFSRLSGLKRVLREMDTAGFELIFLFGETDDYIQKHVDRENFDLFCTPVINLFEKRLDRIDLSYSKNEYVIVADKTRPYDFEVYSISSVEGIGRTSADSRMFYPFYRVTDHLSDADAFYTTRREVRRLSGAEERFGRKSSYLGSQLYIDLVDGQQKHYETDLRQLALRALCTNRHLPLSMARGEGSDSDFEVEYDLVETVNFLGSPTVPREAQDEGSLLWRMVNHLHSNFHSIVSDDVREGGQGLREILGLFAEAIDTDLLKQIEALENVTARPITRRFHTEGPVSFVRGQEVTLVFDERTFGDSGIYLLGQLIGNFLSRYVMVNAFVETVLVSKQRGELKRWKPKTGSKAIL